MKIKEKFGAVSLSGNIGLAILSYADSRRIVYYGRQQKNGIINIKVSVPR